jgi:hypothetical protein
MIHKDWLVALLNRNAGSGQALGEHGANVPMEVSSSGSTDHPSLVTFVVDSTKPLSSTASIE